MIWANYQWGKPWSGDAKQNGAAIAVLIYFAYFVLKGSLQDEEKQARIGSVYNIFAYFMLFPCIWILPRLLRACIPAGRAMRAIPGSNPKDTTNAMRTCNVSCFYRLDITQRMDHHLIIRYRSLTIKNWPMNMFKNCFV
jgi:heme exporter protein C